MQEKTVKKLFSYISDYLENYWKLQNENTMLLQSTA